MTIDSSTRTSARRPPRPQDRIGPCARYCLGPARREAPAGGIGTIRLVASRAPQVGTLAVAADPAANELVNSNPLALLLGMLLDQQVPLEWAFMGPLSLQRR